MILVTPISLAMTRFLATVQKKQTKIVPGLGTRWYLPGTEMFVILIHMVFDSALASPHPMPWLLLCVFWLHLLVLRLKKGGCSGFFLVFLSKSAKNRDSQHN